MCERSRGVERKLVVIENPVMNSLILNQFVISIFPMMKISQGLLVAMESTACLKVATSEKVIIPQGIRRDRRSVKGGGKNA